MGQQQISQVSQIFLTSGLTIFGGLLVLILGQIIQRFFIEPIQEQSKVIGKIASDLSFYANVYSNPGFVNKEMQDEASKSLRQVASELRGVSQTIPWYGLWAFLRFVPKHKNIIRASANLIGLSNGLYDKRGPGHTASSIDNRRKETLRLLRLKE
jgi:hypothetical protein